MSIHTISDGKNYSLIKALKDNADRDEANNTQVEPMLSKRETNVTVCLNNSKTSIEHKIVRIYTSNLYYCSKEKQTSTILYSTKENMQHMDHFITLYGL